MSEPPRVPSLVVPFAIVGGAAGWMACDFLGNPVIDVAHRGGEWPAAGCAAVVAAIIGKLLTRWCATRMDWHPPKATWMRLVISVLVGGALVGAIVTWGMEGELAYAHVGAGFGVLASVPFIPVCAVVLATAKRAERARLGSLVAGADRRAVWGILATALAVPAAVSAIDWPVAGKRGWFGEMTAPWPAIALLGASVAALAYAYLADRAALARVQRAFLDQRLEERAPGEIREREVLPLLDFGLGEDMRAEIAPGALAYRSRERAVSLVLGSPEASMSALRSAARRDAIGIAVVLCVLGAHGISAFVASRAPCRYRGSQGYTCEPASPTASR
jgi:hypothetical protein